jgi:hypothetical protein
VATGKQIWLPESEEGGVFSPDGTKLLTFSIPKARYALASIIYQFSQARCDLAMAALAFPVCHSGWFVGVDARH